MNKILLWECAKFTYLYEKQRNVAFINGNHYSSINEMISTINFLSLFQNQL